jgi:hypothetical protein
MKMVVISGTGLIGKKVVMNLHQHSHQVVAALPSLGVNNVTGEGPTQALAGAQLVVDVANAPSWDDNAVLAFFESSGRNLLAAEAAAGIGHHVALSVVGTDRLLASRYFRAKLAEPETPPDWGRHAEFARRRGSWRRPRRVKLGIRQRASVGWTSDGPTRGKNPCRRRTTIIDLSILDGPFSVAK